jgi:hypothetical protein
MCSLQRPSLTSRTPHLFLREHKFKKYMCCCCYSNLLNRMEVAYDDIKVSVAKIEIITAAAKSGDNKKTVTKRQDIR